MYLNGAFSRHDTGDVQRAASYFGPEVINNSRCSLCERFGASNRADAEDSVDVCAQPVLGPDGCSRLGYAVKVRNADAETRIPSNMITV